MALVFQADSEARKNIYQFMFGENILVAPIYQQGNHRTVYMPEGEWIDFWSGEKIIGKKYIEVNAQLDKIPLYVKSGSIIPLIPDDVQTLVYKNSKMADSIMSLDDRRILQIWPGKNGSLKTWDGINANLFSDGNSTQLNFFSEIQRALSIEIMFKKLDDVKVENAEIKYDETNKKTVITFQNLKGKNSLKWIEP
jgi:alpha-glucosidase (family GH31 glycosyl hydrolase)